MASADSLVADGEQVPNLIKIDVEGYEFEVIEGMAKMLCAPQLRTLCIKVHFTQLADRGLTQAPRTIEANLREAGFGIDWVDASHIVATRGG